MNSEDIESRIRRLDRRIAAMDILRTLLIACMAIACVYNLTQRRFFWAEWDVGLVAFNFWYPRAIERESERRKAEVRAEIAKMDALIREEYEGHND